MHCLARNGRLGRLGNPWIGPFLLTDLERGGGQARMALKLDITTFGNSPYTENPCLFAVASSTHYDQTHVKRTPAYRWPTLYKPRPYSISLSVRQPDLYRPPAPNPNAILISKHHASKVCIPGFLTSHLQLVFNRTYHFDSVQINRLEGSSILLPCQLSLTKLSMSKKCAKLDGLPRETLQQVAGHLHGTHRPSLYAFGLANKTCRSASLRWVFREIHLSVHDSQSLQCDVAALVRILSDTDSGHCFRHLSIKGSLSLHNPNGGRDDLGQEHRSPGDADDVAAADNEDEDDVDWSQLLGVDEILGDEEPFLGNDFFEYGPTQVSLEEDMAWAPVVNLVKSFPYLTKLVYDCHNQFPPSLLDTLHKYHPQCRLHHLTFRLRSLRDKTPDPHEMSIASSPCLHSIKVRYAFRDTNGQDDYNGEAILELIAGLAPNLKEVRMIQVTPGQSGQSIANLGIPRKPWRGLPGFAPGQSAGSLQSLSLEGAAVRPGPETPDYVKAGLQHTSLSSLRHLTLGGGFDYHYGVNDETMDWIVQNCSFPGLKTLRVRLDRDNEREERPNYTNSAKAFLMAFPPLDELSVSGSLEPEILDALLSRHGRTLQKLSLCPMESSFPHPFPNAPMPIPMQFTKNHILQIQSQCPALQDLSLAVKRTMSDAREVEIYQSFGQLVHLRKLFLTLDCSDWRVTRDLALTDNPLFDEDDRKHYPNGSPNLRTGHFRESLINCAVDEKLARSIWDIICRNKMGKRLDSLKLYTTGGGSFGDAAQYGGICDMVDHLSRSWLVERSVRDDEDTVIVRELGRQSREARDRRLTKYSDSVSQGYLDSGSGSPLHIFRRIWPAKNEKQDWREDWTSFPLYI